MTDAPPVDAQRGVDDTHSPEQLALTFAGATWSKPAIYTSAAGVKLNNDMQEALSAPPPPTPPDSEPAHSFHFLNLPFPDIASSPGTRPCVCRYFCSSDFIS